MKKNLLMIILFFITITIFPVVAIILPDKNFSENENRILAEIPKADIRSLRDESFMNGIEAYISDQFPGRESWIIAKNNIDSLIGKTEIGGVITLENQMVEIWKEYDETLVNKNLKYINDFARNNPSLNVSFILSPTVQGVSMEKLPEYAGLLDQSEFISECYNEMEDLQTIDIFQVLSECSGEYIFYRTDHHWTSLGAYFAYTKYCQCQGIEPYDLADFEKQEVSNSFRGTLFSKTLDKGIETDRIDYYILKENEPEVIVEVLGENQSNDGLYYREYLEEKDKYSSFLGSNEAIVYIKSNIASNGKSLLLIKDSYANALVPFLSKHFENIIMVDLRYLNPRTVEKINLSEYSDVLFTYNVITFSEERGFFMLEKFKNGLK